jgi:predicted RNA binding protein YcfA (HicA-like mRNA interferase family)
MRKFPAIKARRMLRILKNKPLSYFSKRTARGSDLMLHSPGRKSILFYYHPNVEISGRVVKEILIEKAGLIEEQAWKLIH